MQAIQLRLQRLCFGILIDTNLCFGITKQRLSRDCENDKTTIRVNTNCLLQQHNLGDKQTRFCFDFVFPPAKRAVKDRSVPGTAPKGLRARKTEKREMLQHLNVVFRPASSEELWSPDQPRQRETPDQARRKSDSRHGVAARCASARRLGMVLPWHRRDKASESKSIEESDLSGFRPTCLPPSCLGRDVAGRLMLISHCRRMRQPKGRCGQPAPATVGWPVRRVAAGRRSTSRLS